MLRILTTDYPLEPFKVHILGCGSALPTLRHFPSMQVVEVRGKLFMVDCGEGAQIQLRRSRLRFTKISAIFLSHLHGDHCLGLIGIISSFGLLGRVAKLTVYAPAELYDILQQQIRLFCSDLSYEVIFEAVDTTQQKIVYEDRSLTVETIPLNHRVKCCGYLFREKPTRNPDYQPRSYAYCSDTRYIPTLHERLRGVSTLYHESTYGEDNLQKAEKYYHSTARQAAQVARDAGVGQLLLGHYSSRYDDEGVLLREAREVFENSRLSDEMMFFDV